MSEADSLPARSRRPSRDEVQERILRAAAKVFADNGFAGARLDQIAEAAGFTKGAVYSNFANKDALFFALMDAQIAQRSELALRIIGSTAPTPAELADLGAQLTEATVANRDWQLLFLEFWQRAVRDETVRVQYVEHRRVVRSAMVAEVEQRAAALGLELPVSAENLVFLVMGLSNGLALEEIVDPGVVPRDLMSEVLCSLLEVR
ncbi:MAG: TetR family transcriptional regulator [Nocardia sp.]|uniref:TetR/AcrR family transcriptional regulator n=1 Tax=Nocardia sp. TaxID=1821 RepID=UPI0026386E8A|nr:TetR/AcrR family transcriptional regulator [Nocardia sp.]MCU1647276.1 TetR family transcriptional regulator [Nocardia sp.]